MNDLSDEGLTVEMKDALRLNASAVSISIFVGTAHERQTLLNLAKLVDEGEDRGMPVMAITAVGKELEKRDARYLALACRIAAEIGAHVVKTYYCEGFSKVVEGCPGPAGRRRAAPSSTPRSTHSSSPTTRSRTEPSGSTWGETSGRTTTRWR